MKCTHCGSDTNYKDRRSNGGKCGSCKHPFAFEPKTDALGITDGLFQRAIKDVSGDDTVFFTERQLGQEFNRRLAHRSFWRAPWGWVVGGGVAYGVASAVMLTSFWPMAVGASCIALGVAMNHRARRSGPLYVKLAQGEFVAKYLAKWVSTHGAPAKLLPPGRPPAKAPDAPPPDVTAYSFDRALVTDNAQIAAMLVANNFHFENNCAILSRDGYPENIVDTIMAMLRRNPQLTVFALHDASVSGCFLPHTLREERWFPDKTVRILDLGLRPQHAQKMRLLVSRGEQTTCPPELRSALTTEEIRWLESGNVAELAAMRPARLMRAIYQGFARANQTGAGDVADGGIIWFYDGGADVYAADSFG